MKGSTSSGRPPSQIVTAIELGVFRSFYQVYNRSRHHFPRGMSFGVILGLLTIHGCR
jgi:hypothetical protein